MPGACCLGARWCESLSQGDQAERNQDQARRQVIHAEWPERASDKPSLRRAGRQGWFCWEQEVRVPRGIARGRELLPALWLWEGCGGPQGALGGLGQLGAGLAPAHAAFINEQHLSKHLPSLFSQGQPIWDRPLCPRAQLCQPDQQRASKPCHPLPASSGLSQKNNHHLLQRVSTFLFSRCFTSTVSLHPSQDSG